VIAVPEIKRADRENIGTRRDVIAPWELHRIAGCRAAIPGLFAEDVPGADEIPTDLDQRPIRPGQHLSFEMKLDAPWKRIAPIPLRPLSSMHGLTLSLLAQLGYLVCLKWVGPLMIYSSMR